MRILSKLIAVVTLPIVMAGCVNAVELSKHFSKPKVVFATPAKWDCSQELKLPGRYREMETCNRCVSKAPDQVTLNDQTTSLPTGGRVLVCATSAFIE